MDWALLASSIALVIATVVLAIFTYQLWKETLGARQPQMVASLDWFPPSHVELRLTNAGAGPALSVDLTFRPEGGEERRWAEPVVMPNEGYNVHWLSRHEEESGKGLTYIIENHPTMNVSGEYQDVRGRTYSIDQTLDVKTQNEEARAARRLVAFRGPLLPFYELLKDLRDELQGIRQQP